MDLVSSRTVLNVSSMFLSVCLCVLITDIMLDNLLHNNEGHCLKGNEKVTALLLKMERKSEQEKEKTKGQEGKRGQRIT